MEAIVHDASAGLVKTLAGLYPRVRTRLRVFHKPSNISQNLTDGRHRSQILKDAAAICTAETEKEPWESLKYFRRKWGLKEPKAVRSFIKGFEETLTHRDYKEPFRT